jgi:gliding motility-associated-like protein
LPPEYTVTVSDTFNCVVADTFELLQPDEIVINAEVSTSLNGEYNINCFGENTGFIKLLASGGDITGNPYQYQWDHGPTTSELYNLSLGEYRVTVTDGLNCHQSDTFSMTQPLLLQVDSVGISSYNGYEVSCMGSSNGTIFIRAAGGAAKYTFNWNYEGIPLLSDTAYINNLKAGSYSVTIIDSDNCQTNWVGNLEEPPALVLTFETRNVSCTGAILGSATAEVTGGVAPVGYSWDNGAVIPSITSLDTGNYVLTVQDMNLCTFTDTAIIEQNTEVRIDIQIVDPITCYQASDGSLRAIPLGGVSPYTYTWADGPSTQSYDEIGEGTYSVTVTDNEGCIGNQSKTFEDPEPLKADLAVTDPLCFRSGDGSVMLGAQGGTGIYQYYWNDNLIHVAEVGNLAAGSYNLRIKDAKNCETDTLVIIQQPEKLHISIDKRFTVYPFCPDWQNGTLAVAVTGGKRDYKYIWTGYPGESDSVLHDIKENSYKLRIIDAQDCITDTIFRLKALNNTCLGIPTAFTPNYDNANDTWDISYINENGGEASFHEVYPDGVIQVYDRLGNLVYRCTGGCSAPWNGEDTAGRALPVDTYYYVIELNTGDDQAPLKGIVTIIR